MKNLGGFLRTQKQWFCVVVLALACAGMAFAQQAKQPAPAQAAPAKRAAAASGAKKNAITFLDIVPLFKGFLASDSDNDLLYFALGGLAYERLIVPHVSIGPNVDIYFGKLGEDSDGDDVPYLYFSMLAAFRYYIMSANMEKLYIGAGLGFNVQSIDGKTKEEEGGFVGPIIRLETGYRVLFKNVFFIEPSIAYVYSKYNGLGPTPLGWQGGLRFGIEL